MTDFRPTFDQAYAYFAYRLPLEHLAKRDSLNVRCPFHEDKHPSMSLNLAKGVWNCRSCNLSGGMLDFERQMMHSDPEVAWAEIYRITGMEPPKVSRKLAKVYDYTDVTGRLLYQKLRYEPKDFSQRQPDGKGGWWYNLNGVKKVLYRLPDVVTAKIAFVVEGEKDADNLRDALIAAEIKDCVVTTTFDGAGHWKAEYAPYFTGRMVVVLRDNDAKGKAHQQTICASVKPFAERVKAVDLPGLPEKGDVSDWLKVDAEALPARVKELLALVKAARLWEPAVSEHVLLEEMQEFIDRAPVEIEWLVEDLIPVRTRGLMVADGKVGKASPLDTPISTPDGWKPMGAIRKGAFVTGSNGLPTEVLQVHPQGVMPCFRVTMSDGVWVETTAEHVWSIQTENDRTRKRPFRQATTAEIADLLERGKDTHTYLPLVEPVIYKEKSFVISPYVMGVILANGGLTPKGCRITTADPSVMVRVREELPVGVCVSRLKNPLSYGIRAEKRSQRNVVIDELARLGLMGHKSTEKWIPQEYLEGSVEQRWALLQGLMDSDGCFEAQKLLTYTSASHQLALGVQELFLSLGGTCRMKPRATSYTKKGSTVRHEGAGAYTLVGKLERSLGCPFWQERKHLAWERSRTGLKKKPCRKIVSVAYSRDAEAQCITVAAPDGLYVTQGYIVTHNSPLSLDLALALASGSAWLGHVVPRRRRVAVVSREDAPQETARRLRLFREGTASRADYNWGQIWLNTMDQSAEFLLDHIDQVDALIKELMMEQFDLVIFDVFRNLHTGDENDNETMAAVLKALTRIQEEARCAVLMLHHISKAQSGNVFRDARGFTGIHGWTEWGVGMTVVDETVPRREWVRKVDFELKYACPADPVYFKIVGDDAALRIDLVEQEPTPSIAPRRRKIQEIANGPDKGAWYDREQA